MSAFSLLCHQTKGRVFLLQNTVAGFAFKTSGASKHSIPQALVPLLEYSFSLIYIILIFLGVSLLAGGWFFPLIKEQADSKAHWTKQAPFIPCLACHFLLLASLFQVCFSFSPHLPYKTENEMELAARQGLSFDGINQPLVLIHLISWSIWQLRGG